MGNRIRELRKKNNMPQIYLSIELEVSQETISAYENGKYYPSFQSLLKLSKIFNASIDYIMGVCDNSDFKVQITSEENILLTQYKRLNTNNKEKALSYINGLFDSQNS